MRYRSSNTESEEEGLLKSSDTLINGQDNDLKEYNAKGIGEPRDRLTHQNFRVLGVEIGSWTRTSQYIFCATGVVFFLLMYGILQEFVVMSKFKRSLGWFVTFLQLSGYAVVGFVQHNVINMKQNERKIPMKYYALFAVLHVMMQGFTNLAMQYLNYPAKTLFKSSRVIVTMLFGGCFMGKRYSLNDYLVATMIIVGLSVFTMSDAHTSPLFNQLGVVYIVIALFADAMILNIQEYCLNIYGAGHDELVYFTYLGSCFVAFIICTLTGEMWAGFLFLNEAGSIWMLMMFILFCSAGFLGMSCTAALTKAFGALTSAITATFRKGLTLVLSYILFPSDKAVTLGHIVGSAVFLGGLMLKACHKNHGSHYRISGPRGVTISTSAASIDGRQAPVSPTKTASESLLSSGGETARSLWDSLDSVQFSMNPFINGGCANPVAPLPFGVSDSLVSPIGSPGNPAAHRHVFVAGSVQCEDDITDGVGGLGIEIVTDDEFGSREDGLV